MVIFFANCFTTVLYLVICEANFFFQNMDCLAHSWAESQQEPIRFLAEYACILREENRGIWLVHSTLTRIAGHSRQILSNPTVVDWFPSPVFLLHPRDVSVDPSRSYPRSAFLPPSPNPHLPSLSISIPLSSHRRQAQPRRVYDAQADIEPFAGTTLGRRGVSIHRSTGSSTMEDARPNGAPAFTSRALADRVYDAKGMSSRSDATGAHVAARRLPPRWLARPYKQRGP